MHASVWTHEDVEAVTAFVRSYCALQPVETGSEGEPKGGYFAFYQGASQKQAKNVRANVARGEVDPTTAIVLQRCRSLAQSGEGDVWLRYYESGEPHPVDALKIRGSKEGPSELEVSTGSAIGDMAQALVMTNRQLLDVNRQLHDQIGNYFVSAIDEREKLTLAVVHSALAEQNAGGMAMEETLKVIAPTLEAVGPKLAEALVLWLGGGAGLPQDPGARIEAGVSRIMAMAQDVGKTMQAHPKEATPQRLQPLVGLMQQLAPALGYQLVPLQQQQAVS